MALPDIGLARLVLAAAASVALWQAAEYAVRRSGPDPAMLRAAAASMQHATEAIREEKSRRNLMQGERLDPNRTGLIGPEWSETTTTLGDLPAKRTLTNPDTAALVARLMHEAHVKAGDTVAVVLSGSFVGGNVAVMSAVEAYGLKAAVLSSLGASMYGAADPSFTWLDMESTVRAARIWRTGSLAALLGGESGMARDLGEQPRRDLEASARRANVPLVTGASLADAIRGSAAALGLDAAAGPKLLINVGGAQAALGDCRESADIPAGPITQPLPCSGTPGLVHIALSRGIPVLNLHKVKALAQRYGLPFDPVPLPVPGRNAFIYGN
jgi:poly-gamma-glutamate system protein